MSFREITAIWQYNEPLKRSELLSTHGVGSLKLTTWGVVMPRILEKWPLIKTVADILNQPVPSVPAMMAITEEQWRAGFIAGSFQAKHIRQVEDRRFVRLLSLPPDEGGKGYTNLQHLIDVPQVELNRYNQFKSNALRESLPPSAVHFPKYFYDPTSNPQQRHLRQYPEALKQFQLSLGDNVKLAEARKYFVPPRSARTGLPTPDLEKQAASRDLLAPVPVVLMCAHGHLSDVPWARYLGARHRSRTAPGGQASGGQLPGLYPRLFEEEPCCANPQLLWQSRGRTTDSFAGVQLSCGNPGCQASTDLSVLPRIRPACPGHRPWVAADDQEACPEQMQYALTTGTNLYFPISFSGIYLPEKLLATAPLANPEHLADLRSRYEEILEDAPDLLPITYWNKRSPKLLEKYGLEDLEARKLRAAFLNEPLIDSDLSETATERLKREEYEIFTGSSRQSEIDFKFTDVQLVPLDPPSSVNAPRLAGRLALARRVDELRLTKVQLAFTRVQGLDPDRLDEDEFRRFNLRPQRIHENAREQVTVLPALTSNGEGIFLELNLEAVARWETKSAVVDAVRALHQGPDNPLSTFQQQLASKLSARLLLVHTLSHLLIRELEWKCGYPAPSLNERIYVRPAQSAGNEHPTYLGQAGLLLYATEGSQGSMGGLTFQARPAFLEQLLREALDRALDCPADPICWHADAQAGTPLVRAACFACTMTAETSCELQNTLLDRRLLIDPAYGFFSDWEAFLPS